MASGAGEPSLATIPSIPTDSNEKATEKIATVSITIKDEPSVINSAVSDVEAKAQARPLTLERAVSMFAKHHAHKNQRKWYSITWSRLVRVLQLLTALDVAVPIGLMYKNGSICPYPVICSHGPVEIALLFVAKICATLMYVPLAIIIGSKCATLRAFVQSTYVTEMIDLYGLHEMHVNFGLEVCLYAVIHVITHFVRLSIHNHKLFLDGGRTVNSGYPAAILFLILVPPFACEFVKRRVSFEVRKAMHMLSLPALVALAFHHYRLSYFATILLCVYSADWLYSNLFKTYRVQKPFLFPIGTSGTVIEFLPPEGFNFHSGQYLFVCAPYISKYEWHPFSVIPATTSDGSLACSMYALACGDWTKRLLEAAKRNSRRPIWINGAHPSPFDMSIKWDFIFLVCTGIGITPGISVVSQYCYSKVIVLIWVCRDEDLINLYSKELQIVNGKVFYTGGKGKHTEAPRIDGNVLYCTGRPDMCQEIKNVILKKRPPQWMAAPANDPSPANAAKAALEAGSSPAVGASPGDLNITFRKAQQPGQKTKLPVAEASAGTSSPDVRSSTMPMLEAGELNRPVDQPFRRAMMDLYEVDRQEEVEHTEWLVLYCGASAALGNTLDKYCKKRGIHFRTEFFGSW